MPTATGVGRKRAASAGPPATPPKRTPHDTAVLSMDNAQGGVGAPSMNTAQGGGGAPPTSTTQGGGGAPPMNTAQGGGGAPPMKTVQGGGGAPPMKTVPGGGGAPLGSHEGGGGAPPVKHGCVTPVDARLANHVTVRHMMTDVVPLIEKFLCELEDVDPVSGGGIAAFDQQEYAKAMVTCGSYECHVTVAWFDVFNFVHKTVVPSWGSVLRVYRQFFHNTATGAPCVDGPLCTVHVRATSQTEPPQKGGLHRLDNDAYLLAFLYAWAQATAHGTADQFRQAAARFRVAFQFLPDADTAERRKWVLMEAARSSSENQHLFGIKRAHAVHNLQQELKLRGARHDAEALTAWFNGVKFCHSEDAMTKGSIERQLKIFTRMSADQRIMDALDKLESMYGKRHALASSSALDVLCNRTAVKGNVPLQTTLAVFMTEAILVMHARGDLPLDTSRDTLGTKIIPQVLLKRRVISYLASKFRFADRRDLDVAVPADRTASVVLMKVFGSFATFHTCFPKGRAVADVPVQDGEDQCVGLPDGQSWLTNLLPCQQSLLEFIKDMCACRPDIEAAVKTACLRDQSISAECFMARDDVMEVFNLSSFTDEFDAETRPPTPAAMELTTPPTVGAAAEPPPTEAAAEPPSTTERIPDDEGVPAPQDDVQAGPPVHPADSFFPLLHVGRVMRDKLQKVEDSVLRAMIEHASMRVAMYVELKVRPTDNDKLSASVQELSIFQQAKDADGRRIIWSYDAKCWIDGTNLDTVRYGYRQLAEFDDRDFAGVCDALFGMKDQTDRFDECLFRVRDTSANDLMIVFDGRRATTLDKVEKIVRSSLKGATPCFAAKLCMPVRMMHTNAQFVNAGGMRRSSGDAVHTSLPDPLESFALIFCKSFKLPIVARMFIDLPGTSRTRGLNQVPPRDSIELTAGVTVKQKRTMLDSASFRRGASSLDDTSFDIFDDPAQQAEQDPDTSESGSVDSCVVPLFTWENGEILWRELLNMYRPRGSVGGVVDFTVGSGLAALASVRHKVLYAGFGRTAEHVNYVRSFLVLMIVGELIDGKNDGFMLRKFLGRQRSLGGGHEPVNGSLDRVPQPYGSVAAEPSAALAAPAAASDALQKPAEDDDSDSASSSDSE